MRVNGHAKFLFYAHLILAVFLIWFLFDLITLLYDNSNQFALTDNDLNNKDFINSQTPLIPKIIHQTYKDDNIPNHWKNGQKNCQILNPDYQYILWTDEMARNFIKQQYPWFLNTFDNYPYPIQRADVIRYFILSYYGGIYIDLDDGCNRNLDPLLNVPAFVRKTLPTGISNDVMGSIPNHPFFIKATNMLKAYQINWLVPYITIMFSTGPLFLSVVWKQYIRWGNPASAVVRILMPNDYKNNENSFFQISKGSSWHNDDAAVLLLMSHHIILSVIFCTLLGIAIILSEYFLVVFIDKKLNISTKFYHLLHSFKNYFSNSSSNSYNSLNNSPYANIEIPRKTRKDSNLPAALSVDLEKNVYILDDIIEH